MALKVPGLVKTTLHSIWIFCAVSVILIVFLGFNVNLGAAASAAGRAVGETWNFIINAWESFEQTADMPAQRRPDNTTGHGGNF